MTTVFFHWGDTGSLERRELVYKEGELPPSCVRAAGVHGALPGGGRES